MSIHRIGGWRTFLSAPHVPSKLTVICDDNTRFLEINCDVLCRVYNIQFCCLVLISRPPTLIRATAHLHFSSTGCGGLSQTKRPWLIILLDLQLNLFKTLSNNDDTVLYACSVVAQHYMDAFVRLLSDDRTSCLSMRINSSRIVSTFSVHEWTFDDDDYYYYSRNWIATRIGTWRSRCFVYLPSPPPELHVNIKPWSIHPSRWGEVKSGKWVNGCCCFIYVI